MKHKRDSPLRLLCFTSCRCVSGSARGASVVGGSCALGSACGAFAVGGLAAARRGTGGAFPLCLGVERFFQPAGPSPPEAVGVPLGVGVCFNLVFVTLIYVST